MKTYSIEPASKKSIEIIETWYNEELDRHVQVTDIWRWGRWYITADEKTIDELRGASEGTTLVLSDYDVEFDYVDDGVGRWIDFSGEEDEETEALQEEFEQILDDEGWMGIEDAGWEYEDSETYIHGELILEEVE